MFVLVRFNMSPEDSKRFIALDSLPWIVKNVRTHRDAVAARL
mgnify:CR=1 FL=1